ncbi:MAG TPA: hypothetical protein VIH42_10250 [Thermoguttaceae bacterium]
MAPPIYFFPKIQKHQLAGNGKLSQAILAMHGDLARTFADVIDLRRDASLSELTGAGPGGASGCLLTALPPIGEAPVRLHYAPEFQTWSKFGEIWVGIDKEYPPTAADLIRKKTFEGYRIEIAGQEWSVPVIRDPEGATGLPRAWSFDDGGQVTERIKDIYQDLWRKFERATWLFYDPAGPWPLCMELNEAVDLCLETLSINYRLGRIEQNLLGLVDSENWFVILAAAVDEPTYREVYEAVTKEKKTRILQSLESAKEAPAPGSIDILPGPPADCQDTGQAAEN